MRHIIFTILLGVVFSSANAQRITRHYNNVSISEALRELNSLQKDYTVNFIYDELEDFKVTADVRRRSVPDVIHQLIGFYPIKMICKDRDILVECTQKTSFHITGRLVDENKEPLAFASIKLTSPVDSAVLGTGVSNESGVFVIPCGQTKIMASISFIGYKTVHWICTTENIGTIEMQPERYTIKGVVVKGERPQYKMAKGGMTVDIEHSLLSQIGTARDVLGQLPRVDVKSDGTVSVFAKGTPDVYINNRKITDNTELTRLKSNEIKSVDIITNPGAQYDAVIESVIRIKTIRQQGDGFSFRSATNGNYNSRWGGWENLNLKYRTGGLEVFADLMSGSRTLGEDNIFGPEIYANDSNVPLNVSQIEDNHYRFNSVNGKFGFNYDFGNNSSTGVSYTVKRSNINTTGQAIYNIVRGDSVEGHVREIGNLDRTGGYDHDVNVYYIGKIGNLGIDFNGTYTWVKSEETRYDEEYSDNLENRVIHTGGGNRSRMFAGKLILSYPIAMGELNLGSEMSHTSTTGTYMNEENYVTSSDTKIKENNIAGFAEYTLPLGDWNINAGLRYEHVSSDYHSFGVKEEEPSRRYGNFFPNISASWNKGQWGIQFNYTEKTKRPYYYQLRNFIQYDNRYMYEGGNPELRPSTKHSFEIDATYSWLSLDIAYNYIKNPIFWTTSLYGDKEIALTTFRNFNKQQTMEVSAVASPKLGWYQPMYEIDYWQQFFHDEDYGFGHNLSLPEFQFTANNRFVISNTFFTTLNMAYYTRSFDALQETKGYFNMDVSVNKSFLKGALMLNLYANDILKTQKDKFYLYGKNVIINRNCYTYTRCIGFTVTYNFNATKSKYKGTGAGTEEKKRL